MKRFLLILLVFVGFQSNATLASFGCEYRDIEVKWRYDNLHVKLDGFRLYNEGSWVCETEDPLARKMSCEVFLTPPSMTFWLNAFEKGGSESVASEPFTITVDNVEAALAADVANGQAPLTVNFDASASKSCMGTIETYFWDFGDGETGVGEFITHSYTQGGTFYPTLYVSDSNGQTANLSQPIIVSDPAEINEPPVAKITADLISGYAPFTVNLDASSSIDSDGQLVQYEWNFGDGGLFAGKSTSHTFSDPGEYMINLVVTDNLGATSQDQVRINVSPTVEYTEAKVNFQPETSETPEGFLPDWGKAFSPAKGYGWADPNSHLQTRDRNSTLSVDQTFDTLVFPIPGSTWEIAVPDGDYGVSVVIGDANYPETLNFVQIEDVVFFENAQLSKENRWMEKSSWVSVADGRLTVKFAGSTPHSQLCRITVGTNLSQLDNQAPSPPVAIINATTSTNFPYVANFSAKSSYDLDGTIIEYNWNFGDGGTGQGQSVNHEYSLEGQFTVTLDVRDDSGNTSQTSSNLIIRKNKFYSELYVNFQPPGVEIPEGFSVDYGNAFSIRTGYGWTRGPFGDGTRDRDNNLSPSQAYDTLILAGSSGVWEAAVPNGTYRVTLCAGDATYPISVQNVQIEGESLFVNEQLGSQYPWVKSSIDVAVEDGRLTVLFEGSEPFAQICWIVIVNKDHDDTNTYPIPVLEANTNSHAPLWVSLNAGNSSDIDGTVVDYLWDFGDGTTSSEISTDHLYLEAGIYPIKLKVTDNSGGIAQRQAWVAIPEAEHREFSVNFQTYNAAVPENFLPDSGGLFNETAGYGWIKPTSNLQTRDRNDPRSPDQKHDTLAFSPSDGIWEAAVPEGLFRVTICVGDPTYPISKNNIQVEGLPFVMDEQVDQNNRWIETSGWVQVLDGRLTVEFAQSDPFAQLCWIKVEN